MNRTLLRGGRILDGSGADAVPGDVLIEDSGVRAVGPLGDVDAETIEVPGRILAPGFVDVHAHDDVALLKAGQIEPKLRQGVTADVVGNCGHGCAPLGAHAEQQIAYSSPVLGSFPQYLDRLASTVLETNALVLVPHGSLRAFVAGYARRAVTADELALQAKTLDEALERGAAGLSLGLMYASGDAARRTELVRLAEVVARHGKVLAAHIRSEGDAIEASLDELLDLGGETGVRLQLSHLKVVSPGNHGRIPELLERLDWARAQGIDITADVYPYPAGSTTVAALFPGWALADGTDGLLSLLDNDRARILAALGEPWEGAENNLRALGGERIMLAGFELPEHHGYEGATLASIAVQRGTSVAECLCELVSAERARLTVVLFQVDETDVATALSWPWSMIGSDGLPIDGAYTHARTYGTFPRVLSHFAGRTFPFAEAIRRMTCLPAQRFGLSGRGVLRPDAVADLVVLDPERLADRADFGTPRRFPLGVDAVLIGGRLAVRDGATAPRGDLLRIGA